MANAQADGGQGKPLLSSKLRQMKFMQRREEQRRAEADQQSKAGLPLQQNHNSLARLQQPALIYSRLCGKRCALPLIGTASTERPASCGLQSLHACLIWARWQLQAVSCEAGKAD